MIRWSSSSRLSFPSEPPTRRVKGFCSRLFSAHGEEHGGRRS